MRLSIAFILLVTSSFEPRSDCSDDYSFVDDVYDYAKRASGDDHWDGIKGNLKRAMDSFEDAKRYAGDCGCEDGHSNADDG
jgi:hypothetical protein